MVTTESTFILPCHLLIQKKHYDYVIVDEAHRLRRYYSKSNNVMNVIFKLPAKIAEERGVNGDELPLILKQSQQIVLLDDPSQQIRPGDITHRQFQHIVKDHHFKQYALATEYRIHAIPGEG